MIHLTEEMRRLINHARDNGNPCIIATADGDGRPNAGYYGTIVVLDDESLAYRDRGGPSSLQDLEDRPQVVVLFRDSASGAGWTFRCTAEVHRRGPISWQVVHALSEHNLIQDPYGEGCAVVLRVDQVLDLFGQVLQEREEGARW